ncbi:MAG: hypothetical protein OES09_05750, partial [Gammaproteobacteria bacterium]|nr:hypothetical protein [Gammaproteobacteria bacterium]
MLQPPLTAGEIEDRLEEFLDPVLSSRRTAEQPSRSLAAFPHDIQEFVLRWVGIIVKTNAEMGFQFAQHAAQGLELMGLVEMEEWVIRAMDIYDKQGLYPGCSAFQDVEAFASELAERRVGVGFDEVAGVLERFILGLSGRVLKLAVSEHPYTDTETLFLPARLAVFSDPESNFRLYKAIVAHLWAQTWFGTFHTDVRRAIGLADAVARFPDPEAATRVFHALETARLNARLREHLEGLHRDMLELQNRLGAVHYPVTWRPLLARLERPDSPVNLTYELLELAYRLGVPPGPFCFQGILQPQATEAAMRTRQQREKQTIRYLLSDLVEERAERSESLEVHISPPESDLDEPSMEMVIDGNTVVLPPDVEQLLRSIQQDFGEIPGEYLVPAGDGAYQRDESQPRRAEDVWKGTYHEEGAYLYNEWDHRRTHYRKNWCVLREIDVYPSEDPIVERTLARYSGLVAELRRTFEALRGEDRLLKKQKNGDDIDLDAVVEACADARSGLEMSDRVFTKLKKSERDMAVIFMVDMSGSTKGWINEAEREALVLLCEALEILGDRYAIYGFSGMTRKRCELFRVKRFDEAYSSLVKHRIAGIRPQDYTRMGVIIRHLTWLLRNVEARTKLLITLSDGKPDDYDGYRGDYGI